MPAREAIERGYAFEDRVANILNLKKQPGSGNKFYAKNDCVGNGLSFSCKAQAKFSWAEILNYLNKSIDDSSGTGNIPVLSLEDGKADEYIVMRLSDFQKALKEVKIPEHYDSKGIKKRSEAETPIMLRK
jgi:hypothetical protein